MVEETLVHLEKTKQEVACGISRIAGLHVSGDPEHVTCPKCLKPVKEKE